MASRIFKYDKSETVKNVSYKLQFWAAWGSIAGAVASLIIGFWGIKLTQEANRNRDQIDTLANIASELRNQSIGQKSLDTHQMQLISGQNAVIDSMGNLIKRQDATIDLIKNELSSLNNLLERSNVQVDRLTSLLQEIEYSNKLQNHEYTAIKELNFYPFFDTVSSFNYVFNSIPAQTEYTSNGRKFVAPGWWSHVQKAVQILDSR